MIKSLMTCALVLVIAALLFESFEGRPLGRHPKSRENYAEECQHEGCDSEEISEMCASYTEECIGEGCSKEEIIELAGNPLAVQPMFQDLARHGCKIRQQDEVAAGCQGVGSTAKCWGVVQFCQDSYLCPGGGFTSSWYPCGACLGFGETQSQSTGQGGCASARQSAAKAPAPAPLPGPAAQQPLPTQPH